MTRADDTLPPDEPGTGDVSSLTGHPDAAAPDTGGGPSVGRVTGQDVGYAGETGAERREAVAEAAAQAEAVATGAGEAGIPVVAEPSTGQETHG